ncbi:LacI family transcriptional regulator [Labrys okinawensis]|uniref:LacI family transcriptional regulator n=1 Tax=Labrys okinawensis TaxID=346911 RepID=A0A2S9QGD6_9HYPH|nr:LacI family DNA-binding transcriptional regulator [Labrys okinawensis]PRH88395.1 LacI family transcriptional regulator [Labrys okinawensis]
MTQKEKTAEESQQSGSSRPARLLDVARLAKVSRATAARALGGYGLVTEETRERVAAAARALNYRLNEAARAMRAGRTQVIGVVLADISNSFFASAARAIIDTCASLGYQTLIVNTDDDLKTEIEAVQTLTEKRVAGMIVVPSSPDHNEHLQKAGAGEGRMVLLDRRIADIPVSTVTTDDRGGAREAVELFIARGHTRIGLVVLTAAATSQRQSEPRGAVSSARDRVLGAREALEAAGLDLPKAWLRYTPNNPRMIIDAVTSILRAEPRPTAILATCEEIAIGVLAACRALNLVVGRDVALVSFDESPWSGALTPAISVVQRPIYEMGRAAVNLLVRQIQGGEAGRDVEMPTILIDRESVFDLAP